MSAPLGARPGDRVSLRYRLSSTEGAEIVNSLDGEPVTVTLGAGDLHPSLEEAVEGLAPGQRATFVLPQAFGSSNPELEQDVPLAEFPDHLAPAPGQLLEFTLPSGDTLAGAVVAVDGERVRVDFNHPLAGCDVVFEVEVVAIGQ
ncbi:MAG TPA: FKBP-type peptidyl-prolyl cis-trans isomerase [Pelomicrobium sp.]|nr:FKBP-type peptidyl-prolyl cis-trans isomerase [Pelomicrobium sp.]